MKYQPISHTKQTGASLGFLLAFASGWAINRYKYDPDADISGRPDGPFERTKFGSFRDALKRGGAQNQVTPVDPRPCSSAASTADFSSDGISGAPSFAESDVTSPKVYYRPSNSESHF